MGGAHAIKSVKPCTDILEGLSTGVQVHVSAPHLMHKWLHKSLSPSFMLLKSSRYFIFAPHALACLRLHGAFFYFSRPFVLPRSSRPPNLTQIVRCVQLLCNSLETEAIKRPMRTGIHRVLINFYILPFYPVINELIINAGYMNSLITGRKVEYKN